MRANRTMQLYFTASAYQHSRSARHLSAAVEGESQTVMIINQTAHYLFRSYSSSLFWLAPMCVFRLELLRSFT